MPLEEASYSADILYLRYFSVFAKKIFNYRLSARKQEFLFTSAKSNLIFYLGHRSALKLGLKNIFDDRSVHSYPFKIVMFENAYQ